MAMLPIVIAALSACDAPTGLTAGEVQVGRQSLVPVIESIEPESPAPGDEVTIKGYFHKLRRDDGLFVSFNGYDSMKVTQVSDSLITAVVPAGATSGNVVVVIGDSTAQGRFIKIHDKHQDKARD
ncbi:MAG TPA: IPT/TIG domain-containing protein [Stenomitos sp.]